MSPKTTKTEAAQPPVTIQGMPPPGSSEDEILAFLDAAGGERQGEPAEAIAPQEGAEPEGTADLERAAEPAEKPTEKPAEKPLATDEERDAYEAALVALRRWKTPREVLETMDAKAVIAWGERVGKMQRDLDSRDEKHTRLPEPEKTSASRPETGRGPAETEAVPALDLGPTTTRLAKVLGLDEQEGEVLGQSLHALVDPLARRLAERDSRDAARDNVLAGLLLGDARRGLRERFPGLDDEATFAKVRDKALGYMRGGGYDTLTDAMDEASRVVFYDTLAEERQSHDSKRARDRERGSPSVPATTPSPKALTLDERESIALAAIEAGKTPEEAAAAAGW